MATIEDKLKEVFANADFDSAELQEFENPQRNLRRWFPKGLLNGVDTPC